MVAGVLPNSPPVPSPNPGVLLPNKLGAELVAVVPPKLPNKGAEVVVVVVPKSPPPPVL